MTKKNTDSYLYLLSKNVDIENFNVETFAMTKNCIALNTVER